MLRAFWISSLGWLFFVELCLLTILSLSLERDFLDGDCFWRAPVTCECRSWLDYWSTWLVLFRVLASLF